MERSRFETLDAILDGALDRPPQERSLYLDQACGGDVELRLEVEKLIDLAEREDDSLRSEGVLAGPLGEELARDLEEGGGFREVQVGDQLGAYRLVEFLGKGGMGQVFAAEDTKLGRRVALKLLPPEMASPERRQRFDREAKAVAALNHPNIVHLYSIEDEEGLSFLTMELVEGSTLGERIPEGGLSLKSFFEIAIPLADAISAAHERGVIHRDIKPGNVMIGEEGRVKILDFGLAKLAKELFGPGLLSASSATGEGHILGTVSHMSPEQAEGKALDPRTDIFSFGVLLYEMCTGRLPFRGETPTAVVSAILKDTPAPVTDVNPRLPNDLARIIKRCLAKDPARRYQAVRDLANELEELAYELDSRRLFRPVVGARRHFAIGLASALAAAAVVTIAGLTLVNREREPRGDLLQGTFTQLTTDPGPELHPSLSPDGSFLVYTSRASGSWDIYLLRAGGRRPINLTEDSAADDTQPAFSPDGQRIAFHSSREGGGLFVMGATGDSVRRVTSFGWNPSWSPDGESLVFATEPITRTPIDRPTTSALWIARVDSGETALLTEGDAVQPSWSPNGSRIAYWGIAEGSRRDLFTIPAAGGTPVPVTKDAAIDWNPVWSPDGRRIYFASDRGGSMNLWRIEVDESSGEVRGEPEPVRAPSTFATHATLSGDGTRMAYTSTVASVSLASVPFDSRSAKAGPLEKPLREIRNLSGPRASPDGAWIVFWREGLQEDIVLVRADGSDERLLTDDPYRDRHPRWSPDGERIVFYSDRSGKYELWSVGADGSGLEKLTDTKGPARIPVWSPDGSQILSSTRETTGFLFDPRLPWSEQEIRELPSYPSETEVFVPFDWSPDGTMVAGYLQTTAGVRAGIVVHFLETGRYEKLADFGLVPYWMGDSRRLVFQGLGPDRSRQPTNIDLDFKIFVVDRVTKEVREVLALPGESAMAPALTADGTRLYFVRSGVESDIWMLSATGPGDSREPR